MFYRLNTKKVLRIVRKHRLHGGGAGNRTLTRGKRMVKETMFQLSSRQSKSRMREKMQFFIFQQLRAQCTPVVTSKSFGTVCKITLLIIL